MVLLSRLTDAASMKMGAGAAGRLIFRNIVLMPNNLAQDRGRVIGIGGVFLKSPDHDGLRSWYQQKLGLEGAPEQPVMLKWRSHERPEEEHLTVWSTFPDSSDYFDPSGAPFMINYIVDDLDALLAKLERQGVKIDPKREDYEYGRFAWIFDPDGNKVELWEPPKSQG
jgi:catechol 2,3-dioxygenase-like lactoylglutathione lyase family enzyme